MPPLEAYADVDDDGQLAPLLQRVAKKRKADVFALRSWPSLSS